MTTLYDFKAKRLSGGEESLRDYRDKVVLVVNVASKCGFTPQYKGLEALHRKYAGRGLAVLGFPCNQFGAQEPGSAEDIAQFCSTTYDVTFPIFEKIDVNGPDTHPVYGYLKAQKPGLFGSAGIKWNFTKFLIDRAGRVVGRFGPATKPEALEQAIAKLL